MADSFKSEFKRSKQEGSNLQQKYESIANWAKMISEANTYLKDEFLRSQNSLRLNVETLIEIVRHEQQKDVAFQTEVSQQLVTDLNLEQSSLI